MPCEDSVFPQGDRRHRNSWSQLCSHNLNRIDRAKISWAVTRVCGIGSRADQG